MVDTDLQFIPQDNNMYFHNATVTATESADNYKDFNVAASAPEGMIVIEVLNLASGDTVDVQLRESSDKFASNDTDTKLGLTGIAADGMYFLPVNNKVVRKRSFRPKFVADFATGNDCDIKAYFVAKEN